MKFQVAEEIIKLKRLSDSEYEAARRATPQSLDVCPTCGGKDESIPDSGMKHWVSPGYWVDEVHYACNCQLQMALYARYVLANIGTQYMRLDWTEFAGTKEADIRVNAYIEQWQSYLNHGYGLTFASKQQGVGKTWAATHIGKELIKRRQNVYFLDFVEMVDAFCSDNELIPKRMREATFLILDDVRLGISERQNDLYALKFEVVVRHRTNFDLPTIFTTNLSESEFEDGFPRIYSLIAPKQMWVEMNGMDYRKQSKTAVHIEEMIHRNELRPIT